ISAAGIVATIWVLVTEEGVIAGFDPKFTVAPATKPVPVRVNVKAAPPAAAEVGATEARVKADPLIVNDRAPDVPPPAGFVTVTFTVPAVAISAAGMVATICVLVTEEGVIGLDPKLTVAPATKPVPVRVNVKAAPPAAAEVGAIEARVKADPLIVNDRAPDVPPPAGFVTVTFTVPAVAISAAGTVATI